MKKEGKIKSVKGFNQAKPEEGFGNMGVGSHGKKSHIIPSIMDDNHDDIDTRRAEKRFNSDDHNNKGQRISGSDHDIETTAVPGTEATYNEEIGIVVNDKHAIPGAKPTFISAGHTLSVDPLIELEKKINAGLIENTTDLFEAALETMRAKNADYSGDNRGMRNFEISAEVSHTTMSQGILNRLMDKMTRIGNLLHKDQAMVKSESIFDTIQDAINYSAILYFGILMEQRDRLVKQNEDLAAYEEERNG